MYPKSASLQLRTAANFRIVLLDVISSANILWGQICGGGGFSLDHEKLFDFVQCLIFPEIISFGGVCSVIFAPMWTRNLRISDVRSDR